MPEKQITREIVIIMLVASFLTTVAKALSEEPIFNRPWTEWAIRIITGMTAGLFFGSLSCWIFGENQYAVFAITGAGVILGMDGVRKISQHISKYLESRIK